MLDGKRAVIAAHAQRGNEVAPEMARIAEADRAENPGAIGFIAVVLGIEDAVTARVPFVNGEIFGVNMPDRAAQIADGRAGIDALPEEVRGIKVRADFVAHRLAELQERLGIINDEAGMHFEGDFANVVFADET